MISISPAETLRLCDNL